MLFFVMYDIEDNRVRNLVSKYLVKMDAREYKNPYFSQTSRLQNMSR